MKSAKIIGALVGLAILPLAVLAQMIAYYPHAAPTRWYVLPGQWLGFTGGGFAPGERIEITDAGTIYASTTADTSGAFGIDNAFIVPFSWQDTTQTFTFAGDVSDRPISQTITVGTFYPQISPSSYWIGTHRRMQVSGVSFAPNERVRMWVNGTLAAQAIADTGGAVRFTVTTPDSGASAVITAEGMSSTRSSTRVIYLRP